MKKTLLSMMAIAAFGLTNAQNSKVINVSHSTMNASDVAKISAAGCQTLAIISPTSGIALYTIPTSTGCTTGGYVFGNNCFGDAEVATYFPASYYAGVSGPSITAVSVGFYRNPANGMVQKELITLLE